MQHRRCVSCREKYERESRVTEIRLKLHGSSLSTSEDEQ